MVANNLHELAGGNARRGSDAGTSRSTRSTLNAAYHLSAMAAVSLLLCCPGNSAFGEAKPSFGRSEVYDLLVDIAASPDRGRRTDATKRLLELSEKHGAPIFLDAIAVLDSKRFPDESMSLSKVLKQIAPRDKPLLLRFLGALFFVDGIALWDSNQFRNQFRDDSMSLSNLLKRIAPRDKALLLRLLGKGQSLSNLVLAELLVEIGVDEDEANRVTPYVIDVFMDENLALPGPEYARATVLLARLRPRAQVAGPRFADVISKREYSPAHFYAAYALSKLDSFGPEAKAYVPKLLAALRRVPGGATDSFLPAEHGLDLSGLDDLKALVTHKDGRDEDARELEAMARKLGGPKVPEEQLKQVISDARIIRSPWETVSFHSLISDTLVRVGPFAVPELMKVLEDKSHLRYVPGDLSGIRPTPDGFVPRMLNWLFPGPDVMKVLEDHMDLRYAAAEILSRMRPTPHGFVPVMLKWLEEDDASVYSAVEALHSTGLPEVKEAIERGVVKLEGVLRDGCRFSPVLSDGVAQTIGQLGHVNFACKYYASVIRREPVFADLTGGPNDRLRGGHLTVPFAFKGLVHLGARGVPTLKEFTTDKDWRVRFMANVALREVDKQGHP